ncbi:hypothetical protein ACLQ24_00965 [Micromonospora sp. DT4]|uniref:hypothetical protein n=1 Tax=Micromonospora sp. DT4 TaxID=3393438 RepID=UPI003CEBEDED
MFDARGGRRVHQPPGLYPGIEPDEDLANQLYGLRDWLTERRRPLPDHLKIWLRDLARET